jgi:hypothetical protein
MFTPLRTLNVSELVLLADGPFSPGDDAVWEARRDVERERRLREDDELYLRRLER